jgi:hypothetical protein
MYVVFVVNDLKGALAALEDEEGKSRGRADLRAVTMLVDQQKKGAASCPHGSVKRDGVLVLGEREMARDEPQYRSNTENAPVFKRAVSPSPCSSRVVGGKHGQR